MSAIDQVFMVGGQLLAFAFVVLSVWKGSFRRFAYLNVYIAAIFSSDLIRPSVLHAYGIKSTQYFLTYYISDFLIVNLKYLAILSVLDIILRHSTFRQQARMAFIFFFALVGAISCFFTADGQITREFLQNMYFASVVLTVLLCLTLAHLRVADPQLRMLVCGLGVSGALQAGGYAMQNLLSKPVFQAWWSVARFIGPVATVTMLGLWCYSLLGVQSTAPAATEPEQTGADAFVLNFAGAEARS